MIRCPDDVQRLARFCTQEDRAMLRLAAVITYVAVVAHYEDLARRQRDRTEIIHMQLWWQVTRMLHICLIQNIAIAVDARRTAIDCISSDCHDALDLPD